MTTLKCFFLGLFMVTFSLSSINVGHASRKLFQQSNGLEGLKQTLNEIQKLVNSPNPPREADLKQIKILLEQMRDLLPKPDSTKGTRRLLSKDARYLAAKEDFSKGYDSRNVLEETPLMQFIQPTNTIGSGMFSQPAKSYNGPSPSTFEIPALPKLPTLPPFPSLNALPPLPSHPKFPSLPPLHDLPMIPRTGSLPPLPSLPKIPYVTSPKGAPTDNEPKKPITNPSNTQAPPPMNKQPGNTRMPSRLLLATPRHLLNMQRRKLASIGMPEGIMYTETRNVMTNDSPLKHSR